MKSMNKHKFYKIESLLNRHNEEAKSKDKEDKHLDEKVARATHHTNDTMSKIEEDIKNKLTQISKNIEGDLKAKSQKKTATGIKTKEQSKEKSSYSSIKPTSAANNSTSNVGANAKSAEKSQIITKGSIPNNSNSQNPNISNSGIISKYSKANKLNEKNNTKNFLDNSSNITNCSSGNECSTINNSPGCQPEDSSTALRNKFFDIAKKGEREPLFELFEE